MMGNKGATRTGRHSVKFGRERIGFSLSFTERKRLKICVHPNQRVTVDAPIGKPIEDVLARVKKRAPWIIKQRDYFERFQPLPPERKYVSGETHIYLGRQYRLKVVSRKNEDVKLIGRFLYVYASERGNRTRIEELLQGWYREHGRAIFERRLELCFEASKRLRVPYPSIRLRKMKKRWGSCSKSGNIILNTELVKAPLHCIDYVITHELCHLKFPNHNNGFYRTLSSCMPDWEKRKQRLEQVII